MEKNKILAVILAAGKGSRMESDIPKQYMDLKGMPVFLHSVKAFQKSEITHIALVVSEGEIDYVKDILDTYTDISKVKYVLEGGKERYLSVYNALLYCENENYDIVLIHDSARAMIKSEKVNECIINVKKYKNVVLGVPVKDTTRVVDEKGLGKETLNRSSLWCIQTPQGFIFKELIRAYRLVLEKGDITDITDDAMIMEKAFDIKSKVIMGDYSNIKITTKDDIYIAETLKNLENNL